MLEISKEVEIKKEYAKYDSVSLVENDTVQVYDKLKGGNDE